MKSSDREGFIGFVAMSCCDDERMHEVISDRLIFDMEQFDDDTLAATAMILGHRVEPNHQRNQRSLVRSMIMDGDSLDIRTLASHLDDLDAAKINLDDTYLLLSSLRDLGLLSPDEDYYPFLKSHADLSRYSRSSRIPYHQNEQLIRLVHEYPEKHEEIVKIVHIDGITDIDLAREHLLNAAPVLAEGIL
jgi:hypothetical protein